MRKLFTTTAVLCTTLSLWAQVPNGSMENWVKDTLALEPEKWHTTNSLAELQGSEPNVFRSNESSLGNFSAYAVTTTNGFDPVIGAVSNTPLSELQNITNPGGGVPFAANPDSIFLDLKYDIKGSDHATILVIFKKAGMGFPVGINSFQVSGTQGSFATSGFALQPMFVTPDSVIIIVTSSDLLDDSNMEVGSEIWVDNIRFNGSSPQIPNYSFEDWVASTYEYPEGWSSFDFFTANFGITNVTKSTDSHDLLYAARLENQVGNFFGSEDTIPGFILSSESINLGEDLSGSGGYPFSNTNVNKLMGYYKFSGQAGDSATIGLFFRKNGVVTDSFFKILPVANAYTLFELPVSFSQTPDTALIIIVAGYAPDINGDEAFFRPGNVLYVDKIDLNDWPNSVADQMKITRFDIYPNPGNGQFSLALTSVSDGELNYGLYDLSGKAISQGKRSISTGDQELKFAFDSLANGTYLLKVDTGSFQQTFRVVISK